jgi:hypothetical protein
MPNLYLLAGAVVVAMALVGVVVARLRQTPHVDQVSLNVLNRIRTEYR